MLQIHLHVTLRRLRLLTLIRPPARRLSRYLHCRGKTHASPFQDPSVPEYHRSSFSAAAKYYAQSITDKFSSYGTSPPAKKTGTSPSAVNELSSSLPSGSWSKSVSFAASSTTGTTARGSSLSRSFDDQAGVDAYDSDKTIEDSSMVYTPRVPSGPISVAKKNRDAFTDDVSGCSKTRLISEDLVPKCFLWCQYYADQLRCWGMLEQAAELDKIASMTLNQASTQDADIDNIGIVPTATKTKQSSSTCTICFNTVRDVAQVCPACLHVCHLHCLESYITELHDEQFTCPASCGCLCSELAFIPQEIRPPSPQVQPVFKKKASFTDPRRWRARVEGDSW